MLPACRTTGDLYELPPFALTPYYYSEPFNRTLFGDAQMTPIPSPGGTSCSRLLARKVRCSTRRFQLLDLLYVSMELL